MKKPTNRTLKIVGIGALGLFLLSRLNLTGKIGEGLGGALGDTISDTVGGLGDVIGGGLGGVIGGAGSALANVGTGILTPFVDLFAGAGTGETWANTGKEELQENGLSMLLWSRDQIAQHVQPNAIKIVESSGYTTPSGYTYFDPKWQLRGADIQRLRQQYTSAGDAAYMLAVEEGVDVSGWDMSHLTDAFKTEIGVPIT